MNAHIIGRSLSSHKMLSEMVEPVIYEIHNKYWYKHLNQFSYVNYASKKHNDNYHSRYIRRVVTIQQFVKGLFVLIRIRMY